MASPYLPDAPFADFHLGAACMTDAAALAALSSKQNREAAHAFYARLGFKPHGVSLALSLD